MNQDTIVSLTRDLKFIAQMIQVAAKADDKQAAVRYLNSAGNLLNKISEEVVK